MARMSPEIASSFRGLARAAATAAALVAGCAHAPVETPPPPARHVSAPTDGGLPPGAAQALAQRFPGLRPLSHSSGRLQVDDADDLAVVLAPPGRTQDARVAVLVTGAAGDWRVAAASAVVSPGCEPCTVTVDIARHLLSVHVARPADADFERSTWQFGYREPDDALRLLAVTGAQPAGDDPIAHAYAVSTSLATGAKLDTLDPGQAESGGRRELRSSVPLRRAVPFDACTFAFTALAPEFHRLPAYAFEPSEPLPASVTALLRARFPGLAVQSRAGGALRGDGARDLALVLAPAQAGAGDAADTVIALLQGQPDGSWKLAAASGPVTHNCAGCEVQARIAHRALVVQTTAVDGSTTRVTGWQFMLSAKDKPPQLRLVGVRSVMATRRADGDSRRYVSTANLATGDKLDVVDEVVHGRLNRTEHASHAPVRPALGFAGFVFDPARLDAQAQREQAAG